MRSGIFGNLPTISECRSSPALGREWGIERPSVKSVGGEEFEVPCAKMKYGNAVISLYRHPELLVPECVDEWVREYDYAGDNYSIVPYLDRHPCAIELKEYYDTAMTIFKGQK